MPKGDNVRLRADGRYEARYVKGRDNNGKPIYCSCYGKSYEEAVEKREYSVKRLQGQRCLNLLILGAGSHGQDVYAIAKGLRLFSKIAFLDDVVTGPHILGKLPDVERFLEDYPVAIVAIGDEELRKRWTEKITALGFLLPTLVHPTAFLPENTPIGPGTVICARATVGSGVKIGRGAIVDAGALVPRNTVIPDWGYFDLDRLVKLRVEYVVGGENARLAEEQEKD